MSLATEYPKEQRRCRAILEIYKGLGVSGIPGSLMIQLMLDQAEDAAASGDVVAMVRSFKEMKELKA